MKLNLGSGHYPQPGWVNVDLYEWAGIRPDVKADVVHLPFFDNAFTHAYCGHVLEHLEYETEAPAVLREIKRVLIPGGWFCAVGPDLDRIYAGDDAGFGWPGGKDALIEAAKGINPDYPRGWAHEWAPTEDRTVALVRQVFPNAHALSVGSVEGFPINSRVPWQCAVVGER